MTAKPLNWPPEPGDGVWVAHCGGEQYVSLSPGRLCPTDNVADDRDANVVWDEVGPLVRLSPQPLAAALRRHAHEIECRTTPSAAIDGPREYAKALYARADEVSP